MTQLNWGVPSEVPNAGSIAEEFTRSWGAPGSGGAAGDSEEAETEG